MRSLTPFAVVLVALATVATAQVTVTVGPSVVPAGCPAMITIANDTPNMLVFGDACPYDVLDASGNFVFQGQCPTFAPIYVFSGQAVDFLPWYAVDGNGAPLPPGSYTVVVHPFGIPPTTHNIVVSASTFPVVHLRGPLRPGTARFLSVCSPGDTSLLYAMAASFTTAAGIPTCGGLFPLDNDGLFQYSTQPNQNFVDFVGTLNTGGLNFNPYIALPNLPWLTGTSFNVAFATVDLSLPCSVVNISSALAISVQ